MRIHKIVWTVVLSFALGVTGATAQLCTVKGSVVDAMNGESLIGAYVKAGNVVAATDFEGAFELKLPKGEITLVASYIGYADAEQQVVCEGGQVLVRFKLETLVMDEAVVAADIAISRKTPVAFSNVKSAQIQEELAGRDMPLILNTTPGIYATQQGGGDGDARVTIRGFDQTNIAVMIDGIPMNDMENGWVYWSNWAGIDLMMKTTQVQRGLGASKLAIPSVGGTINILTGGDESQNGLLQYQTEVGSYGYMRNTLTGVFGSREKGFLHILGSYRANQGWVEGLDSQTYAYYLKGRKVMGNHNLSFTTFGAPQRHGQRPYKLSLPEIDGAFSNGVTGVDLPELGIDVIQRGRQYNEFIINYQETFYDLNDEGDVVVSEGEMRRFNPRQNFYYKPIFTLRDVWSLNDKMNLITTAYASFGSGGGQAVNSTSDLDTIPDGTIDFQPAWDQHQLNEWTSSGLNFDEDGLRPGRKFLRVSHNDHRWFGALSNLNVALTDGLELSTGVDVRHYVGSHYRTIGDLFGADYWNGSSGNYNAPEDEVLREGDKYLYHDDGQVAWTGGFAQLEKSSLNYAAFINVSLARSWYRGIDYFRPRIVTLDGTTYEVRASNEWRVLNTYDWQSGPLADGTELNSTHPGLETYSTEWVELNSGTIKAGANVNFNEWTNGFVNAGYLSRAPLFADVIDINNNVAEGYENQFIKAIESGLSFSRGNFASNVNAYLTSWENKPISGSNSLGGLWKNPDYSCYADTSTREGREHVAFLLNQEYNELWIDPESESNALLDSAGRSRVMEDLDRNLGYRLSNADARHVGLEWDFALKLNSSFEIQGVASFGNWIWTSNERVQLQNFERNEFILNNVTGAIADTVARLDGAKVGDAAQRQYSMILRYEPFAGSYVSLRATHFANHYSNFSPEDFLDRSQDEQSWVTPAYSLLDLNFGTTFKLNDGNRLKIRGSITNLLDVLYIADAQNNSGFLPYDVSPDQRNTGISSEVFVGPPRMVRLSAVLELTGLQNKKSKS